ncbi:hypothetical protein SAMN05445850_6117 [Paraburkholderia tuberum]|uniref:Uncharacterized protein n=1 Tax=Paraburkholderia tuberum TaxID=157910 RepID=A0A1H1K0Y1_9BURK|nr:hypothetical protein SAMN05445850_6117 [Paraburkholderia tuberum]
MLPMHTGYPEFQKFTKFMRNDGVCWGRNPEQSPDVCPVRGFVPTRLGHPDGVVQIAHSGSFRRMLDSQVRRLERKR